MPGPVGEPGAGMYEDRVTASAERSCRSGLRATVVPPARFRVVSFNETMETVARAFEVVGVAIIVIGGALALVEGFRNFRDLDRYFSHAKQAFGRPLILGLEILVAADIIKTITVELSLSSVATLGILVAVRIALSFSLDIELEGALPWQRAETEAALRTAGTEPEER